ncbi:MAG: hypothetical protein KDD53_01845, partial [Bdellovibrionales bacterium]|nr:hypothetical protein [Bdellovibrionales bacterium]
MKFAFKFGKVAAAVYFSLVAASFLLALLLTRGEYPAGGMLLFFLVIPSVYYRLAPLFHGAAGWDLNLLTIVEAGIEYFLLGVAIGAIIEGRIKRTWSRTAIVGLLTLGFYILSFPVIFSLTRIPSIAIGYLDSDHRLLRRQAIIDLGNSGAQEAIKPLLGELRRGNKGYSIFEQDVVVALTRIGGIRFWIEMIDSPESKELKSWDWLEILRILDRADRLGWVR